MPPAQLLPCGNYVSRAENSAVLILDSSGSLIKTYNVSVLIQKHTKKDAGDATVDLIAWERILPGSLARKVAVAVFSHSLVLIFDVSTAEDPIIIDTGIDGIENIEWIPPVAKRDPVEGAYTNSVQIAVFTKLYVALKIYSLDYTHVLFEVPKPVSTSLVLRPNSDFWSVVAEPYYDKNSPKRSIDAAGYNPAVIHVFNEGSVSRVFRAFSLPNSPLVAPITEWAPSGNWLMVFSDTDSLSGFNLQVYNSAGVSISPVQKHNPASVPIGEPIMDASWLTEGVVSLQADSGEPQLSFGAEKYFPNWLTCDSREYIAVFGPSADGSTEVCVFSLRHFKLLRRTALPTTSSHVLWTPSGQRYKRSVSDKMVTGNLQNVNTCENILAVRYTERLAVFSANLDAGLTLEAVLSVSVSETVMKTVKGVVCVFFHTGDHVGVYSSALQAVELLHSSPRARIVGIQVSESSTGFIVGAILSTNECVTVTYEPLDSDDSNAVIASRFQYREEVPKVARLMREAQHLDYGARGARFKRNRFSDVAFAGRLANTDEVTDTFDVKRLKRG